MRHHHQQRERSLDNENGQHTSYLVDASGNAYEPYALSWRYLGMYIDCDLSLDVANDDDVSNKDNQIDRHLGDNSADDCSRKVLWAAVGTIIHTSCGAHLLFHWQYYDPRYRGNSIGEYQFFDYRTKAWDKSTCQTFRCAKLNCHERWNGFRLVGVFKETEGLYDWAEQLFKHEGYCLWDGDKESDGGGSGDNNGNGDNGSDYEFMQNRLESWIGDCGQMALTDSSGNTLYLHTKPLPGGNMTYGLYTDDACSVESLMTFSDYVVQYYTSYYYSAQKGYEAAEYWESTFERWNELMTAYKVCQPCRAYNRIVTSNGGDNDNNNDDGGGAEEQYGYNCYDDAGYRNCNQCYKFESKTDMEPATANDLARATAQGTILSIRVDGKGYGHGTFESSSRGGPTLLQELYLYIGLGLLMGFIVVALVWNCKSATEKFKRCRRKRAGPDSLKEVLADAASVVTQTSVDRTVNSNDASATHPIYLEKVATAVKNRGGDFPGCSQNDKR